MDAATTWCALLAITWALTAVEAVGDVSSASCVPGWWPLQCDTGLIHCGDGVLWSRWRTWGKIEAHRFISVTLLKNIFVQKVESFSTDPVEFFVNKMFCSFSLRHCVYRWGLFKVRSTDFVLCFSNIVGLTMDSLEKQDQNLCSRTSDIAFFTQCILLSSENMPPTLPTNQLDY